MLYLLKSSKFREYHQENLRLLRAPAGSEEVIRYNAMWIPADLQGRDLGGQEAVIVCGDQPYQRFAPIRLGRVLRVNDEGERVELHLELTGRPRPDLDFGGFDAWFAARSATRPMRSFLLQDGQRIRPAGPGAADEVAAWRASVDRLLGSDSRDHFSQSAFLLPLALRGEQEGRAVDPAELVTGQSYSQRFYAYNVHLAPDALAAMRYQLEFDRTEVEILEQPQALARDDQQELRFRVLAPGTAHLELQAMPFAERSNRLQLRYHATGALPQQSEPPPAETPTEVRRGLHRLLDWLDKRGVLDEARTAIGTLERMLLMVPRDLLILRRMAHLHHDTGHHTEAVEVFEMIGLDNLAPRDWLPFFLSASAVARPTGLLAEIVKHLPWDDLTAQQATALGQSVSALPERDILDLLELLAYYGTDRFIEDIWWRIRQAIRSVEGIIKAHDILQETNLESTAGAYQYLQERSCEEGIRDPRIDAKLVEHALGLETEPARFSEFLQRHLEALVQQEKFDDAEICLHMARKCLSAEALADIRLDLAELLVGQGNPAGERTAARLFTAAAEAARIHGELDEAAWHLERAIQLDPASDESRAAERKLAEAIDRCEGVQALRADLEQVQIARLRDWLGGKRLVIVGGARTKPWVEELRQELGLSDVDWHPSDFNKPPRPEELRDTIGAAVGAVVLLVYFIGHAASNAVREEAKKAGIPCALVPRGTSKSAVLCALANELPAGGGG